MLGQFKGYQIDSTNNNSNIKGGVLLDRPDKGVSRSPYGPPPESVFFLLCLSSRSSCILYPHTWKQIYMSQEDKHISQKQHIFEK